MELLRRFLTHRLLIADAAIVAPVVAGLIVLGRQGGAGFTGGAGGSGTGGTAA